MGRGGDETREGAARKNRDCQRRESARRVASASGRAVALSGEFRRGSGGGGRGVERRVDDRGGFRGSQGGCDVARRDLRVRSRARVGAERRVGAARISRGKPRDPPEGASGLRDDDLARVRWRERRGTRRRVSRGRRTYLLIAEERPDGSRSSARRAEARATAAAGSARLARHISAPRRVASLAGRDSRATRASPPRPVPRAKTSSCSRDGSSYVTRSVGRGARGIARGALRGSAAHAGPRSLSTAHQDAHLGSREIFRSVVGPSSSFEPRRAERHTDPRTDRVYFSGESAAALSLARCSFDIHNDTSSRAHTSASAITPRRTRGGLRRAKTPPESVRSVAPKHPVIQPSRAPAPLSPRLLRAPRPRPRARGR